MLEQRALLLKPCHRLPEGMSAAVVGALAPERAIYHPLTGQCLGLAGWRRPRFFAGLSWWPRGSLAVHEDEDAPLVFTVHPRWRPGPAWEVREADGHDVGVLTRKFLKDALGHKLAYLDWEAQGASIRICTPGGQEWMTMNSEGKDLRLIFAETVDGQPYRRMMLLAAALAATFRYGLFFCGKKAPLKVSSRY
jgi:hypothetical protein